MTRSMGGRTGRASGRTAIEVIGLGKRYRRRWALRDCTFRLPAGRICALVGPSGAGKTTLLSLASGLIRPTEGVVRAGGADPATASGRVRTAHLTQGKPLYPRLTVAETLRMGRELNPGRWNGARAERIVRDGQVPLDARVGTLSAGRRTRVAFALALAKEPELLLLDEPLADLDPLGRHQIAGLLLAQAAEHGTTIVLASHVLAELDGICDYLLLLGGGRVRLAGEVDDVIGAHALLMGPHGTSDGPPQGIAGGPPRGTAAAGLPPEIAAHTVVDAQLTAGQLTALVRRKGPFTGPWEAVEPSLEELLLAYLRAPDAPELIAPSAEPVSPRLRHKPGVPGLPRNGPAAGAGAVPVTRAGPAGRGTPHPAGRPAGAGPAVYDQHNGKGAVA